MRYEGLQLTDQSIKSQLGNRASNFIEPYLHSDPV